MRVGSSLRRQNSKKMEDLEVRFYKQVSSEKAFGCLPNLFLPFNLEEREGGGGGVGGVQ